MSNAVLRRYTPPTCTLEISAVGSSLSRWTDRTVLKHVRFQLSFDDPRLISDDYIVVRGDRTDLDGLCEAVQTYVQQLLDPAASRFDSLFDRSLSGPNDAVNNDTPGLSHSPARLQPVPRQEVHLEQVNLVNHDLHLGQLATAESGSVVRLSTLQLFDLANALEEYADDAIALPSLSRASWLTPVRVAQVAAMTVAAVGISASLFKFVVDLSAPDVQTASTESEVQVEELPPQEFPAATDLTPPTLVPVPPSPVPGSQLTPGAPTPTTAPTPATPRPASGFPPITPISPSIATAPAGSGDPTTPIQPDIISSLPGDAALRSNNGDTAQPEIFAAPEAAQGQAAPSTTVFDSIPQVAEARSYFQQRWTPSQELTTVLEYRIVVSPDGSLQQVTPLGQVSTLYRDRTGIPAIGEPFVSPIESGQTARMRLVLTPEGGVQTFLEALN
ncbi:MAG: DUF4335 domain-containing protein [Leptolyngbyaceae cyanobacterium SL_7_1]|nr:DUF4335 domain-containing protein [Leptolyngbyaceae cyanobacterium SL_7_1]